MSLKKAIEFCDIYGESIQLNIKRELKSKTFLGGLLTIITFGLIFGATWSMGEDIIYKTHPSTDIEDQLFVERPFYYLDKYNFPLSFCFQDYDQLTYNIPSYFKFEVINIKTYNTNSTTETSKYEFENCTYDHFPNLPNQYLDKAGIRKYICLKDQNITIGGYWDNEFIQYVVFRIRLCNNGTDGGTCAPQEEIERFINSRPFAYNVYFQNSIINANKYTTPTQSYISVIYKNLRLASSKVANVYIRSQEIDTDVGILFQTLIKNMSYAFDSSDVDDSDPIADTLMDFNFFVANHKPIFHRSYLKVQTVLANIGGLAKAMLLGMYLITFYSTVKLNTTIMNKILTSIWGAVIRPQ
jgi:hypothetical protein